MASCHKNKPKGVIIYALLCPLCAEIRWVGKTSNSMAKRLTQHLRHSTGHYNPRKRSWLNLLEMFGLRPIITQLEVFTDETWIERETYWMNRYRRQGAKLLNIRRPC